jgi:hypothetical protein
MSQVCAFYGVLTKELSINWKIPDFSAEQTNLQLNSFFVIKNDVLVFIFKSFIIHHKYTFHLLFVTYLTVGTLPITFENVFLCKVFRNFIMNILKWICYLYLHDYDHYE